MNAGEGKLAYQLDLTAAQKPLIHEMNHINRQILMNPNE
jgi:hypothetical protein